MNGQAFGKKKVLRDQRQKKLGTDLASKDMEDGQLPVVQGSGFTEKEELFDVNSKESIFAEFCKMRLFLADVVEEQEKGLKYGFLVEDFVRRHRSPPLDFTFYNPYALLLSWSSNIKDGDQTSKHNTWCVERLKLYNTIFILGGTHSPNAVLDASTQRLWLQIFSKDLLKLGVI